MSTTLNYLPDDIINTVKYTYLTSAGIVSDIFSREEILARINLDGTQMLLPLNITLNAENPTPVREIFFRQLAEYGWIIPTEMQQQENLCLQEIWDYLISRNQTKQAA